MPATKPDSAYVTLGRQCPAGHPDLWAPPAKGAKGKRGHLCVECNRRHAREYAQLRRNDRYGRLYEAARARAREQGVPFDLLVQDIINVWPEDDRCPVLGVLLRSGKGKSQDSSPTLDRVNPEFGYLPMNIAVISFRANRAKGSLTATELEQVAAWMRRQGLD